MTWGASLMRLPKGMTISQIAEQYGDSWQVPPIGSVTEIGEALTSIFPDAQHHADESVVQDGHAYLRFNYGNRKGIGTVDSIGVVSNGNEDCVPIIRAVCDKLDLRMVDHQSGEVVDFEQEPVRSVEEYRAFRDRALRKGDKAD
ncbi:hypothetical protein SV7mr_19430 [Stieleria bergensis]|uniref:Uncharacterized protein n=1 Tax=Stieleria bergensis TaxID=2528025 RepID=A0A517STJ0_9BACT|nr:hypothetical protein SV7mr_19430 [Planctomycetes bacterium SV_7m_r]